MKDKKIVYDNNPSQPSLHTNGRSSKTTKYTYAGNNAILAETTQMLCIIIAPYAGESGDENVFLKVRVAYC